MFARDPWGHMSGSEHVSQENHEHSPVMVITFALPTLVKGAKAWGYFYKKNICLKTKITNMPVVWTLVNLVSALCYPGALHSDLSSDVFNIYYVRCRYSLINLCWKLFCCPFPQESILFDSISAVECCFHAYHIVTSSWYRENNFPVSCCIAIQAKPLP